MSRHKSPRSQFSRRQRYLTRVHSHAPCRQQPLTIAAPGPPPPVDRAGAATIFILNCDTNAIDALVTANFDSLGQAEAQLDFWPDDHSNFSYQYNDDATWQIEHRDPCGLTSQAYYLEAFPGEAKVFVLAFDSINDFRSGTLQNIFGPTVVDTAQDLALTWSNFNRQASGRWSADFALSFTIDNGDGTFNLYASGGTADSFTQYENHLVAPTITAIAAPDA